MTMPDEFKKFCRGFHQRIGDSAKSIEDMVELALLFIDPEDVPAVKRYLDELLGEHYDGQKLLKVWNAGPADIIFRDPEELRMVLEVARSSIDTHPNLKQRPPKG